ncbi:hypothetical protein GBA52_016210 [Prunus armeniaca]|nr:hypothetical protein GBA52_016210 [Prunus armeniaca]
MPIPTSPQCYQSSKGNQLGPCRSLRHQEIINPLGLINRILSQSQSIGSFADPN